MDTILHLGGSHARLATTAHAARMYPEAEVVISSESDPQAVRAVLAEQGVAPSRLRFDYAAWDTLTHFTHTPHLAGDVLIVTDRAHMPRAWMLARTLLPARGAHAHRLTAPVPGTPESRRAYWTDWARAWVWRVTGLTLYDPRVKRARWRDLRAWERQT